MFTIEKDHLDALAKYVKGFDIDLNDGIKLSKLFRGLKTMKHLYPMTTHPVLFRGLHSNRSPDRIIAATSTSSWSSWTTDIDTAIHFARQRKSGETSYLMIIKDEEGIDVAKLCEMVKNEKGLWGSNFDTCSDRENEVILRGPLENIYIFEIPLVY